MSRAKGQGEGQLARGEMTRAHPLPCTVPPVLEPAEFQSNVAVARGSPVVLPCEAQGSPLPLVSWLKDGEPLLLQSLERGPGLQLEAAGAGDAGTYSCVAVSEAGEARRHFRLTVMGAFAPTLAPLGPGGREGGAPGPGTGLGEQAAGKLRSPGAASSVLSPNHAGATETRVGGRPTSQAHDFPGVAEHWEHACPWCLPEVHAGPCQL